MDWLSEFLKTNPDDCSLKLVSVSKDRIAAVNKKEAKLLCVYIDEVTN
jgi:hypothetical protein